MKMTGSSFPGPVFVALLLCVAVLLPSESSFLNFVDAQDGEVPEGCDPVNDVCYVCGSADRAVGNPGGIVDIPSGFIDVEETTCAAIEEYALAKCLPDFACVAAQELPLFQDPCQCVDITPEAVTTAAPIAPAPITPAPTSSPTVSNIPTKFPLSLAPVSPTPQPSRVPSPQPSKPPTRSPSTPSPTKTPTPPPTGDPATIVTPTDTDGCLIDAFCDDNGEFYILQPLCDFFGIFCRDGGGGESADENGDDGVNCIVFGLICFVPLDDTEV